MNLLNECVTRCRQLLDIDRMNRGRRMNVKRQREHCHNDQQCQNRHGRDRTHPPTNARRMQCGAKQREQFCAGNGFQTIRVSKRNVSVIDEPNQFIFVFDNRLSISQWSTQCNQPQSVILVGGCDDDTGCFRVLRSWFQMIDDRDPIDDFGLR